MLHLTCINQEKFKIFNQKNKIDYSKFRWTIDEIQDYQVLKKFSNILNLIFSFLGQT